MQVRLIAVDSNGVPVTDYGILHAAAQQASIIFVLQENGGTRQIDIGEAMQVYSKILFYFKYIKYVH